ncbi:Zn-dependent hydrolase [Thiohalobacter sp. COW1]|uniref:Zn-dependent hydrolases n=1 Tax=Thiohalobacter thiocyanaticus TaxID=585455 RepID=A0A1Z4VQL8_9GAMM|nr:MULTISPECIES: MBL fold metallo-hydrolase [Thiohalobacter]BAZ93504.1 Zn-dependent hydrolases [Thiohalobacter thiocyanaticus]BCO31454.1 Zn-dependent hydrolase [Thiohalobacter sp. COW1]
MIFRQFEATEGELSYLLADPVTGAAALIDPDLAALERYRTALDESGLTLRYVLETHLHESHVSAAPWLRDSAAARVAMSDCADAGCIDQRLQDGDELYLGEETLIAIATPGHSACSMVYRWRDRLFTGHTLLVGAAGDTCRSDADPERLYSSVMDQLYRLPGDLLVYPGRVVEGRRVSSIAQERQINAGLNRRSQRADFIAARRADRRSLAATAAQRLRINRECRYDATPEFSTHKPTEQGNHHADI